MEMELVGEVCALSAAVCWALALVFLKRAGECVPPLALNLFKNVLAILLIAITLAVFPDGVETLSTFSSSDMLILALSGVLGIAVGDSLFLKSLNLLGVGLVSIVECLYAPFIILFSFLILSERLSMAHILGTALVIGAVLIAAKHPPAQRRTPRQIILGVILGAASMALMTFGIVIAKPVLEVNDFPLIWATGIRLVAGTVFLAVFAYASSQRRECWMVFKPAAIWKASVPASILGAYLAMIFWVAGFKFASAITAGILNQTSIIFAIILATVLLKESFTRRKLLAMTLASLGVAIVMFEPF